jgi:hypothetical protein
MISRVAISALIALALAQVGADSAAGDAESRPALYYLARADQRLCPSPLCGGLWVKAVNGVAPGCREPAGRECYVAALDFGDRGFGEAARGRLTQLVAEGRALASGRIVRRGIEGFPDLDVRDVTAVWQSSSSSRRPRGVFRSLRDNGRHCLTTPCFSIRVSALNTGREAVVSDVDLSSTGATAAERRLALARIATRHLIAAGETVRKPNAGPAGAGRVFVASQFYLPTRTG